MGARGVWSEKQSCAVPNSYSLLIVGRARVRVGRSKSFLSSQQNLSVSALSTFFLSSEEQRPGSLNAATVPAGKGASKRR